MMKRTILVMVMLLMAAAVFATSAMAEPARTITVQGQGMASSSPDMAVIRSGVVTQAVTPSAAISANNAAMAQLLSMTREFGVKDKDMQTSQFSLSPQYERNNTPSPPQITGYRVANQFTVRLRDIAKLGTYLDGLVRSGANQISGISFEIEDMAALNDKAREHAVADALSRAQKYAQEFKLTLGEPTSIVEHSTSARPQHAMQRMSMQAAEQVPIATGEMTVSASISVVFAIK